jgi:hypothetical protein
VKIIQKKPHELASGPRPRYGWRVGSFIKLLENPQHLGFLTVYRLRIVIFVCKVAIELPPLPSPASPSPPCAR